MTESLGIEKKTYLLTGGAGFIGKNLTRLLLVEGHNVISLDNFENSDFGCVEEFMKSPNYRFRQADIVNERELVEYQVREADIVIHLSASIGVMNAVTNPSKMLFANIVGGLNIANLCKKYDKRLLVASSSEVYGWAGNMVHNEFDELAAPPPDMSRFAYALGKIVEEYYGMGLWKSNDFPFTAFRVFNSTGAGQNNRMQLVLPMFIDQALKGANITVHGDGHQTRCFCHVMETCEAIYHLSMHDESIGKIFNIGSDRPISMNHLAAMVKELVESNSEIIHIPYKVAYPDGFRDMASRVPDLRAIKEMIAWEAVIPIEDIIHDMIEYQRNNTK